MKSIKSICSTAALEEEMGRSSHDLSMEAYEKTITANMLGAEAERKWTGHNHNLAAEAHDLASKAHEAAAAAHQGKGSVLQAKEHGDASKGHVKRAAEHRRATTEKVAEGRVKRLRSICMSATGK